MRLQRAPLAPLPIWRQDKVAFRVSSRHGTHQSFAQCGHTPESLRSIVLAAAPLLCALCKAGSRFLAVYAFCCCGARTHARLRACFCLAQWSCSVARNSDLASFDWTFHLRKDRKLSSLACLARLDEQDTAPGIEQIAAPARVCPGLLAVFTPPPAHRDPQHGIWMAGGMSPATSYCASSGHPATGPDHVVPC